MNALITSNDVFLCHKALAITRRTVHKITTIMTYSQWPKRITHTQGDTIDFQETGVKRSLVYVFLQNFPSH